MLRSSKILIVFFSLFLNFSVFAQGITGPGAYSSNPVFPANPTESSIRSAATAACAAGGGTVSIPAATIVLTQSMIVCNGLIYEGAPWQADFKGGNTTAPGGTILKGNGTFIGYSYNSADLSVPPSNFGTFVAGMLNGAGLKNLSFVNFSYGIKIGGKYNPGTQFFQLENVSAIANIQWGMWFENYQNSTFINYINENNGAGQLARVGTGAGVDNTGNSIWSGGFSTQDSLTARGNVLWAKFSSALNQETIVGEHVNSATFAVSQAATMANLSANIGVTDSTKFPIGMPVTVSASVNGFVANQIYFVLTSAANVITIANTTDGTAVIATGNTAVNLLTKGFSNFEMVGDATSSITAATVVAPDFEGSTTARILLQNAKYSSIYGGLIDSGATEYRTIVVRSALDCRFDTQRDYTSDIDINSTPSLYGIRYNIDAVGGTVTANAPALTVEQTWNNALTQFRAANINVTDTASNTFRSYLLNLQLNGVDIFSFAKLGIFYLETNVTGGSAAFNVDNQSGNADSRVVFNGSINSGQNFDWGGAGDGSPGVGLGTLARLYFRTNAAAPIQFLPNGVLSLVLNPDLSSVFSGSIVSGGSVPVGTTGTCTASSFVGGSLAGKFSAAVCAGGTFILSSLPAAPHGYTCNAQDQTTPADTLKQTANTTTSVTFTSTTAANDVVVFQCMGW